MLAALITTFLFSLTAVFATQASIRVGPVKANLGRLLVAALMLGLWSHVFGQGLEGGQLRLLFLAGMIGFGAGGWCMFQALPRIGSTLSLLVVECAAAILTTCFAISIFDAGVPLNLWIFVLMIIGGVMLALLPARLPKVSRKSVIAGTALASLAAMGQSVSWILTKTAFNNANSAGFIFHPMTAAYQRLLGGVVLAVMVFFLQRTLRQTDAANHHIAELPVVLAKVPNAVWIVANAIAGPVLGVSCMLWAIREVDNPGLVQAVVATATLLTVPMAREMENRVFGVNYFIGAVVAILGVAGLVINA